MSLKSKTLFITGASRGIGLAIGLRAARDGANVIIAAKTAEPHPKLSGTIYSAAQQIEAAGGRGFPVVVDVRNEASVIAAVESAVEHFGGIDICVNNASAIKLTNTLETDMKRYDLMHQINARGTYLVSRLCIPYLRQASNPHVLSLCPPLERPTVLARAFWSSPTPPPIGWRPGSDRLTARAPSNRGRVLWVWQRQKTQQEQRLEAVGR